MPKPIAVWDPLMRTWRQPEKTLSGPSDVYSATWPTSGMTVAGTAYPLGTSARRTAGSGSSARPSAATGTDGQLSLWETPQQTAS